MAADDKPRAAKSSDAKSSDKLGRTADAVRRPKASPERPFDMWLQKQLHAMYDEIASEPLPNDLLNLIDHDAEDIDGKGEPGKAPGGKKP